MRYAHEASVRVNLKFRLVQEPYSNKTGYFKSDVETKKLTQQHHMTESKVKQRQKGRA